MGIESGFELRNQNRGRDRGINYEQDILDSIVRVQNKNQGTVGGKEVNVHEEYTVSRSFRGGSTTEAENKHVSQSDIENNKKWRKAEAAGARKTRVCIRAHRCVLRNGKRSRVQRRGGL